MAVGTVIASAAVRALEAQGSGRRECWRPKCVWEVLGQGLSWQAEGTPIFRGVGEWIKNEGL